MPDPQTTSHTVTTAEIIYTAAGAIATTVGSVIGVVLRFQPRLAAVEEAQRKNEAAIAELVRSLVAKEFATFKPNVDVASLRDSFKAELDAAVDRKTLVFHQQFATLIAQHQATANELDRVRNAADQAERDGAERWAEFSSAIASLKATLGRL